MSAKRCAITLREEYVEKFLGQSNQLESLHGFRRFLTSDSRMTPHCVDMLSMVYLLSLSGKPIQSTIFEEDLISPSAVESTLEWLSTALEQVEKGSVAYVTSPTLREYILWCVADDMLTSEKNPDYPWSGAEDTILTLVDQLSLLKHTIMDLLSRIQSSRGMKPGDELNPTELRFWGIPAFLAVSARV